MGTPGGQSLQIPSEVVAKHWVGEGKGGKDVELCYAKVLRAIGADKKCRAVEAYLFCMLSFLI